MTLSWLSIVRIGLVQTALGAVVVLCTATINRVMIVELTLLAMIPAFLVGIYHGFQLLRPKWGHGADNHARRAPWIIGGMAVLAAGTVGAATATAWMESAFWPGLALAIMAFGMVGLGLGASATNLLALLAAHVAPGKKAAAGSLVWILMIGGLAASGITIGQVLDPYSGARLVTVSLCIAAVAMAVTVFALWGVEAGTETDLPRPRPKVDFRAAASEVWHDTTARAFTVFVFVAMLAYNTQDLILEPFGGHVFGMTPGESTALGGKMHAGALMGMILVFVTGLIFRGTMLTRMFIIGGCIGSGLCLAALGYGGMQGTSWPLQVNVMALGFCNGVFAVAAIGMMMGLASEGRDAREGTRMGVFGAAQSLGFALGAGFGALALDGMRAITGLLAQSYAVVFVFEGALFQVAAVLAWRAIAVSVPRRDVPAVMVPGE
ncbi:MAG: BCD family MFS transporter [Pseudomonadota bacterium]